jgi:O-antigen/teichoic acid export membrane protein
MPTQSVKWGSLTSLMAALSGMLATFVVFRLGISLLGREVVGCWALIQGIVIVARISDTGISSHVTRLVAIRRTEMQTVSVGDFLGAGFILATAPVFVIGGLIVYPTVRYIEYRFGGSSLSSDIFGMTIVSFACGVGGSLCGTALALIEGFGRLAQRNIFTICSNVAMAVAAWPLIIFWGAVGFGLVNLVFVLLQLALAAISLGVTPHSSKKTSVAGIKDLIRELWRASVGLSIIGILRLSFEPTTKFLLSIDGSLSSLASFDLALRISTSVRGLFQSAIQPLLVVGSRTTTRMREEVGALYDVSNIRVYQLAVLFAAGQCAAAPILSKLGFGTLDRNFILFFACLAAANAINSLGIVGYYFQLSSGIMRPLVVIHIIMMFLNIICALLAGWILGPIGIVAAYGLTFAFGGIAGLKLWLSHEGITSWQFLSQHRQDDGLVAAFLSLVFALKFPYIYDIGGTMMVSLASITASIWIGCMAIQRVIVLRNLSSR